MNPIVAGWRWLVGLFAKGAKDDPSPPTRSSYLRTLRAYHDQTGLYDRPGERSQARSIRNPVNRVVSFYRTHLWPGPLPEALPVLTPEGEEDETLSAAVERLHRKSNWAQKKQVAAGWFALNGEMHLKVEHDDGGEPYINAIDPVFVSDVAEDHRGFLTFWRLDVPKIRKGAEKGLSERYTYTEVWDKTRGDWRVWEHTMGDDAKLEDLPPAKDEGPFPAGDFIPVARAKFRDEGGKWGVGACDRFLDGIDEANITASRLHQLFFRYDRAVWAFTQSQSDATGRPLPAMKVPGRLPTPGYPGSNPGFAGPADEVSPGDVVEMGRDPMLSLPTGGDVKSLVPAIDYAAGRDIVRDQMEELAQEMPELLYAKLVEKGEVSGVALRRFMAPAISRVEEARGSAEDALVRAHMMAFTIGQANGFYREVGSFEQDGTLHAFEKRDVLPLGQLEEAETLTAKLAAYSAATAAGYTPYQAAEMCDLPEPEGQAQDGAVFDAQDMVNRALEASDGATTQPTAGAGGPATPEERRRL